MASDTTVRTRPVPPLAPQGALSESELPLDNPRARAALSLIWHEAALLDGRRYEEWDALWAEGGEYVIPIDRTATDFAATLNLVYDDDRMRRMRIERLTGGFSISADAAARTVRTVSRFTLAAQEDNAIEICSAQVLVGYKRGETLVLGADLRHRIVDTADGPRIARKIVHLINSDDAVTASGFLL
ncbi:aromatic-ring-hydroxylating dioxygenase subunit beta [Streptomyces sp. NPDC056390]|uniref:aromatic-ring-hydroxylating dioxygenase subunit beta n=1 Tax=Streptomyces sp. NPDC056390 TaxID=3345806 RepID=UPI0035E16A17